MRGKRLRQTFVVSEIARLSEDFKGFEKPRAVALVGEDFTIGNGLLTPTLKLKRREVLARHAVIIDELYARELQAAHELFERRRSEGRGLVDICDVARAATFGAVDTLLIDIDEVVPGSVDQDTGAVTLADAPTAAGYGVVDEIARRSWRSVLTVRRRPMLVGLCLQALLERAKTELCLHQLVHSV